jgi:H+-transporting ATPase
MHSMKKGDDDRSSQSTSALGEGLTSEEAKKRIAEYGYNEVTERKRSPVVRFLKKFWGLSPWMLEMTVMLEWLVGKYLEMYIVIGLLFFNAIVSFLQEEQANSALELLRQRLRMNARVKREGRWDVIPARELVPGDVIRLRAGDFVPSDVTVAEGGVEVDQSSLTGESLMVDKKEGDGLLSGSVLKRGEITGIVNMTGSRTYFGKTVELVQMARPKLHVQEVISRVSRWLLLMVGITLAIGFALAIWEGMGIVEILPLTVILFLSAIPVALPTMFTITMALGSLELAKKGVLVTRLDASEDAATMDVVCADKTGTMTMNKLSITEAIAARGYDKDDVILYGALASQEANQDPIDLAFLSVAREMGISLSGYSQRAFVPFDPSTRRTEATVEGDGGEFYVLKGSTRTISSLCRNSPEELSRIDDIVEGLSPKGYRFIAVAKGRTREDIELVGVAALYDRPRPDSPQLISDLRDLGISVKMLTGDALPIAKEVSHQLGLGGNMIRMSDLKEGLKAEGGSKVVEEADGFAEIYPEDKYLIVKGLQKGGHVVGMTGDGINDAPALRQAEVGIAVSNATDVAKKASSAVLTVEGLGGIDDLVKTGRVIFQRIATWIINKMIRTFKRVIFIVLAFIITGKYVVSAFDMILLLFLSDYVTLSLSTDNVRYSRKPERWDIMGLVKAGAFLGIFMVVESFLLLYVGFSYFGLYENIDQLHTFVFNWLTFSGYFTVLTVRERKHFWDSRPSKALVLSIALNMVIVSLISMVGIPGLAPINPIELLTVFSYAFVTCLLFNDLVKALLVRRYGMEL